MRELNIFVYEWKHFSRNPFKVVALLLFVLASVYGLHNGANLYNEQTSEIDKINQQATEGRQQYLAYYDEGKKGPDNRPWIDLSTPFWAVWYSEIYHFKTPSPALVYSVGQAEQYGFYKRVSFRASPYDADMTKEIANPERLQTGTLDFTFALLFLLPLLLLILLYNLKSAEAEQGFLQLIEVQVASKNTWLLSRIAFYVVLLFIVIIALLVYGAILTPVFSSAFTAFSQMLLYSVLYLFLWSTIFYFILRSGTSIMGNTLKMAGVWLLLSFIVPGTVHQWISLVKPVNLMTDFIDVKRDQRQELFQQPDSITKSQLNTLFPEIVDSPVANDDSKSNFAMNRSFAALENELTKKSIASIEADNNEKNGLVKSTFWFNPVVFFQNHFNSIAESHYDDYQDYRREIQKLIDTQVSTMVLDVWHDVKVDKEKYMEYSNKLSRLP